MSKIRRYALIVLLVVVISCQAKGGSSTQITSRRSDSLLYGGTNDNLRRVIIQIDPWSQASRLWIETQQSVCCPSRSPDGSQVAYFAREELEMCSLWVTDFDTQNASQIGGRYPCYSSNVDIEWSFDGRYVGFCTGPDMDTVKVYVLDTTTGYEIIAVYGRDLAWSKMSNQLVMYGTREHSVAGLEIVDIPSGTGRWLLDVYLPNPHQALDWMPNEQTIVFSTLVDKTISYRLSGIYAIDTDGSNLRELTRDTAQFTERDIGVIRVSPDGKYLLFDSSYYTKEGISGNGLMVLNLGNGEVRHLASGATGPVAWSPDSKYIAFGSTEDAKGNRVRTWELFLVTLDDSSVIQLTDNEAAPEGLTW